MQEGILPADCPRAELLQLFPGPPACWAAVQILDLVSLHDRMSQFLKPLSCFCSVSLEDPDEYVCRSPRVCFFTTAFGRKFCHIPILERRKFRYRGQGTSWGYGSAET